ncbi:MAG: hypothetical protein ACR2QE_21475 [Acidimicrobiales bacterium]
MTEPTPKTPRRRPKPALASRLVLGGAAMGGGLAMVGAMASAAATEPSPPAPVIHRTVVVDTTPNAETTGADQVPLRPPAPAPTTQPPVAESGGS